MPTMLQVDLELSDSSGDLDEECVKEELTLQLIRQARMSHEERARTNIIMPAWSKHFSTPSGTRIVHELNPPFSDGPPQDGATI